MVVPAATRGVPRTALALQERFTSPTLRDTAESSIATFGDGHHRVCGSDVPSCPPCQCARRSAMSDQWRTSRANLLSCLWFAEFVQRLRERGWIEGQSADVIRQHQAPLSPRAAWL